MLASQGLGSMELVKFFIVCILFVSYILYYIILYYIILYITASEVFK
jgi:hypothetical protein